MNIDTLIHTDMFSVNSSSAVKQSGKSTILQVPIPERNDCSVVEVECDATQYGASSIAHAVEDADVVLTDLLTRPGNNGTIIATLRIRTSDPAYVEASLERYGYHITSSYSYNNSATSTALERINALEAYLNI